MCIRDRLMPSVFGAEERMALRERARAELPARLLEIAAEQGLTVAGVSIRNQRTRWGSCGRDGKISLNWRLVLMPPAVRDYVLLHELMHLKRLDHSPTYWRLVAAPPCIQGRPLTCRSCSCIALLTPYG